MAGFSARLATFVFSGVLKPVVGVELKLFVLANWYGVMGFGLRLLISDSLEISLARGKKSWGELVMDFVDLFCTKEELRALRCWLRSFRCLVEPDTSSADLVREETGDPGERSALAFVPWLG